MQLKEGYNALMRTCQYYYAGVDVLKEPACARVYGSSGEHSSPQAAGKVTVSSLSMISTSLLRGILATTWEISFRASAMTTAKPLGGGQFRI